MNCDELQQLTALEALGALDDVEAAELRQRLERDPEARVELARFFDAASALAGALPLRRPSAALRERVLTRIANHPRTKREATSAASPPPPRLEPPIPAGFQFVTSDAPWMKAPLPGARFKLLSGSPNQSYAMLLIELPPGARYPEHDHEGTEDMFILTGDLESEGRRLGPGDLLHAEPGTHHHELYSPSGCTAIMVVPAKSLEGFLSS